MASQCRHIIWGCFDSTTSERPDKTNFCVPDIYVDKKNPPNEKIESKRHKRILGARKSFPWWWWWSFDSCWPQQPNSGVTDLCPPLSTLKRQRLSSCQQTHSVLSTWHHHPLERKTSISNNLVTKSVAKNTCGFGERGSFFFDLSMILHRAASPNPFFQPRDSSTMSVGSQFSLGIFLNSPKQRVPSSFLVPLY